MTVLKSWSKKRTANLDFGKNIHVKNEDISGKEIPGEFRTRRPELKKF